MGIGIETFRNPNFSVNCNPFRRVGTLFSPPPCFLGDKIPKELFSPSHSSPHKLFPPTVFTCFFYPSNGGAKADLSLFLSGYQFGAEPVWVMHFFFIFLPGCAAFFLLACSLETQRYSQENVWQSASPRPRFGIAGFSPFFRPMQISHHLFIVFFFLKFKSLLFPAWVYLFAI